MSKSTPVSVRLQPGLHEIQQWQLAAIDEGIEAADAERVVAHEHVAVWVASWNGSDEVPMPECD